MAREGSACSAVQGSPVGAGALAVSLHHPPAPQRSWGCFGEEEEFVGTGLFLQQSGPPGLTMTVLSACGERPQQGRAWGFLYPLFPCIWHRSAAGAGVSRSPRAVSTQGTSPSDTGCHAPHPWAQACPAEGLQPRCEEDEDGVSHGPAWGPQEARLPQHPAAGISMAELCSGQITLVKTGRTGWFEPAALPAQGPCALGMVFRENG